MTAIRIGFVGDSLVLGSNDDAFQGWPGRACQREVAAGHDVSLYNLGIRAQTSVQVARRWRAECAERLLDIHPTALVFSFGINDLADENGTRRVSLAESLATARTMMTEARDWQPTLWIGPTPVNDADQPFRSAPGVEYHFSSGRAAELSDVYAELADELGIPYLDLFTPLASTDDWQASFSTGDGVHPTAAGYAMIAERITGWDAWRAWFDG